MHLTKNIHEMRIAHSQWYLHAHVVEFVDFVRCNNTTALHTHLLISFFDPAFDHNRQFIVCSVSLHEIHLDLFNSFEVEFSIAHMHFSYQMN